MTVTGIVAEFNPFHNGHHYLIKQAKKRIKSDYVIAVMSGNFVQRGESAFCDKWTRAKMCLHNGVDMVLELPVISATASAEGFAYGAITILDKSNIVNHICFGAETEDLKFFDTAANLLVNENKEYVTLLRSEIAKGISYPSARQNALKTLLQLPMLANDESFHYNELQERPYTCCNEARIKNDSVCRYNNTLNLPNNILAIEYLKALKQIHSNIIPHIVKRISSGYHDSTLNLESGISSATAIRNAVMQNNLSSAKSAMPLTAYEIFCDSIHLGIAPVYFNSFSQILQYAIRTASLDELKEISDVAEGIENRIKQYAEKHFLISDLAMAVKSKRYTLTRIQRILLHIILGITKEDARKTISNGHGYIRVLGFRKEAEPLLSSLVKQSGVPVIINVKDNMKFLDAHHLNTLSLDILATDIYSLCAPDENKRKASMDLTHPIAII